MKHTPFDKVVYDHNFSVTELCDGDQCENDSRKSYSHLLKDVKRVSRTWNRNLEKMEARAGEAIKKISTASSYKAAIDSYEKEME
ncbi:hypothetical protein DPMN_170715 [Dreissena polymorpha]|uniref:Uncharacterized protein n=1 Tax=Dreissena polymorpha TaxID=45954 RepID=A0A9D4IBS4_DREPO|nr:hypothetical protein DPMN_170715 [Dreissena polymorpha]